MLFLLTFLKIPWSFWRADRTSRSWHRRGGQRRAPCTWGWWRSPPPSPCRSTSSPSSPPPYSLTYELENSRGDPTVALSTPSEWVRKFWRVAVSLQSTTPRVSRGGEWGVNGDWGWLIFEKSFFFRQLLQIPFLEWNAKIPSDNNAIAEGKYSEPNLGRLAF